MQPAAHDLALAAATFAAERPELAGLLSADGLLRSGATSATVCSLVLKSCRAARDAPAALAAWERMRSDRVWPTAGGLQHLLMACAGAGAWRSALAALEVAEAPPPDGAAIPTDVRQWNAVLAACTRAGDLPEAEALLAMRLAGNADATSFDTVLHGYVPDWAGGEGRPARAARADALAARMDAAGLRRTEWTYNALLDVNQHDAMRVLQLLAEAKRAGVCTIRTFAKAARTLWWARRPDEAWALLGSMERAGVEPDAAFYRRCVAAAESVGLLDDADRLHREALRRGLALERPTGAQAAAAAPRAFGH